MQGGRSRRRRRCRKRICGKRPALQTAASPSRTGGGAWAVAGSAAPSGSKLALGRRQTSKIQKSHFLRQRNRRSEPKSRRRKTRQNPHSATIFLSEMRSRGLEGSSRSSDLIEDEEMREIREMRSEIWGKREEEKVRVLEKGQRAENEGRRKLSSDRYGGKAWEGVGVRCS